MKPTFVLESIPGPENKIDEDGDMMDHVVSSTIQKGVPTVV